MRRAPPAAVTFDLFGTLVAAERPPDPAAAVAAELEARGVSVPADWPAAYGESHVEVPDGRELPLADHVAAALASRRPGLDPDEIREPAREAVLAAFDTPVRTRDGARGAVEAFPAGTAVGVLSNCSVRSLAGRTLERSVLDPAAFDAVVTSVGCGWRKPDARAFEAAAAALDVAVGDLVHVGDDPRTDGGAGVAGARSLLLDEVTLPAVPRALGVGSGTSSGPSRDGREASTAGDGASLGATEETALAGDEEASDAAGDGSAPGRSDESSAAGNGPDSAREGGWD